MSAGLLRRRLKPQELTEEDTMIYTHPAVAAALAAQRQATLMAEAKTARLAREVRAARSAGDGDGGTKRPARWFAPRRQPRIPATRSRLARLRPARAR
jgi:hypothetical protein